MKGLKPILALLIVVAVDHAFGQDWEYPYAWVCQNQRCLRKLKSEVDDGVAATPQDVCKLNCADAGSLWPKPTGNTQIGKELVSLYPSKITLDSSNVPTEIRGMVDTAFGIFKTYLRQPNQESDEEVLKHNLTLVLRASSNSVDLTLSTDDSYNLTVTTQVNGDGTTSIVAALTAVTFYGLRHGLETVSQVIAYDEDNDVLQMVSTVEVVDKPVFAYRGIHLDTSRNYYSIAILKKLIDGMSYNKLNIFHWHIIDSYAFPMEIPSHPKMLQYGAYSPEKVYTVAAIKELVAYARQRGVKVIPELDQPAHSGYGYNWGKEDGLGDLVVCVEDDPWYDYCVQPPCGQLNVVNDNVVSVVGDIFKDMFDMFDNDIFHMGGDEVNFNCYNSTPEISEWMDANGFSRDDEGFFKLWGQFQEKLLAKLYEASAEKEATQAILWTSGLTDPVRVEQYLDKDKYIMQIWDYIDHPINGGLLEKGYRVFFSNADTLYLDCGWPAWLGNGHNWCSPMHGWQQIYDHDPEKLYASFTNDSAAEEAVKSGQIVGMETPLWSEQSDELVLETRVWPRGAALAERLWTHPKTTYAEAEFRMVTNRQRMVQRGIQADRLQPEFCLQNEGRCHV